MPSGQEFVTHEFDEAIAVQPAIVTAAEKLSRDHLEKYGKQFGAAGKRDEVAGALATLMEQDSADAVHKMASDMGETALRDDAQKMKRAIKRSADELGEKPESACGAHRVCRLMAESDRRIEKTVMPGSQSGGTGWKGVQE